MLLEHGHHLVQQGEALLLDAGLVVVEEHLLQDDDLLLVDLDRLIRAAVVVFEAVAGLGLSGAFVDAFADLSVFGVQALLADPGIADLVDVIVGVWAAVVVFEAVHVLGFGGAAIQGVGDVVAVVIGIRAAVFVLEVVLVLGLVRAFILVVDDAVAVAILGRRRGQRRRCSSHLLGVHRAIHQAGDDPQVGRASAAGQARAGAKDHVEAGFDVPFARGDQLQGALLDGSEQVEQLRGAGGLDQQVELLWHRHHPQPGPGVDGVRHLQVGVLVLAGHQHGHVHGQTEAAPVHAGQQPRVESKARATRIVVGELAGGRADLGGGGQVEAAVFVAQQTNARVQTHVAQSKGGRIVKRAESLAGLVGHHGHIDAHREPVEDAHPRQQVGGDLMVHDVAQDLVVVAAFGAQHQRVELIVADEADIPGVIARRRALLGRQQIMHERRRMKGLHVELGGLTHDRQQHQQREGAHANPGPSLTRKQEGR